MAISFPFLGFFSSERISYDLLLFQIIQFYRKNATLLTIQNDVIFSNTLSGIRLDGATGTIYNNTIVRNSNDGISCASGNGVVVVNNIIENNGNVGILCDKSPAPQISFNNVHGNNGGKYSGCIAGTGDSSEDPHFVNSEMNDFRLNDGSPCIDAGTSNKAPERDIKLRCRYDDPNTDPNMGVGLFTFFDMGAYEYFGSCKADINGDDNYTEDDLRIFAQQYGSTNCNGDCSADLDGDGDVDAYDLAEFVGYIQRIQCPNLRCEGDLDGDGDVDGVDLNLIVSDFGRNDCSPSSPCTGDLNKDNVVDHVDLLIFSSDFGRDNCQ